MKTKMNKANNKSPEMMQDGNNTVKLNGNAVEVFEFVLMEESIVAPNSLPGPGLGCTSILGANLRFKAPLQRSLSLQHFAT